MGSKKSAAQIRRMQARALARGEKYDPPEVWTAPVPEVPRPPTVKELEAMTAKERRSAKKRMAALGQEPSEKKTKKYKKRKKGQQNGEADKEDGEAEKEEEKEKVDDEPAALFSEEEVSERGKHVLPRYCCQDDDSCSLHKYALLQLAKMSSKERRSARRKMEVRSAQPPPPDDIVVALPAHTRTYQTHTRRKNKTETKNELTQALEAEKKGVDVKEVREEAKKDAEKEAMKKATEEKEKRERREKEEAEAGEDKGDDRKKVNPYIVFVGQISYKTTTER